MLKTEMLHRFRPFLQILKDISIKRTMSSTEIQPEWTINSQKKYHFLVKSNDKFEKYYFAQKVVDTEEEWKTCLESMRQELPQSFRLNTSRPTTVKHLAKILDNFSQIKPKTWPGGKYPTVWQFDSTSRWQLKEDPKLDHLFKLLVSERDCGNLSRQEMVSMIPVMLLDVQSHYRVLDMCSAPGSKTKQVVESLHADFVKDPKLNSNVIQMPSGFVIANEIDVSRCDKLTQNLMEFSSPCSILVNHDGQDFPDFLDGNNKPVKYDRIVCDVPCSGDGTIRKNPNIWHGWHPGKGNGRHLLQYNIIERGVELLDIGGVLAYSSCSMNPVENEAVLARLMGQSQGALELLDCSDKLPGFKYAPGFLDWQVYDKDLNIYQNYEQVPDNLKENQIAAGMFANPEVNKKLQLDRCWRLLPHHNDDGGFFVALVKKVKPLPWESTSGLSNQEILDQCKFLSPRVRKSVKRGLYDNPIPKHDSKKILKRTLTSNRKNRVGKLFVDKGHFNFCNSDDKSLQSNLAFYGLDCADLDLFFQPGKTTYLVNKAVKNIVLKANKGHNIFYAGLKVFESECRSSSSTSLAMTKCGKAAFLAFMTTSKRLLKVTNEELALLLSRSNSTEFRNDGEISLETTEKVLKILEDGVGPVKVVCDGHEADLAFLGFVGTRMLLLDASVAERFHGLLVLGKPKLFCDKRKENS